MVRAFVAFEISEEMRDRLTAAQEVLRKSTARLAFVDPPLIHITVKFLGEVDEKKLPLVIRALDTVKAVPFPATGTGSRSIISKARTRSGAQSTMPGRDAGSLVPVESVLAPLGFPRETRQFFPHATLARVKIADPSLFRCLDELKNAPCGSCMVSGLKLKKSTLTPRGPVYEDLHEVAW